MILWIEPCPLTTFYSIKPQVGQNQFMVQVSDDPLWLACKHASLRTLGAGQRGWLAHICAIFWWGSATHHTPPRQQTGIGCCGVLTRWRFIRSTVKYIHTLNNGVVSNRWHKSLCSRKWRRVCLRRDCLPLSNLWKDSVAVGVEIRPCSVKRFNGEQPMGTDSCVCPIWNIHCRRKSVFLQTRSVELEKMSGPLEPISFSLFGHWLCQSNRTTDSQPIALFYARYFLQWSRECLWKWCYRCVG